MAQVTSRRVAIIIALLTALGPVSRAADPTLEYQVKATFLLNFTRFIEWPQGSLGNADSPFNICILGTDRFEGALEQIVSGELVSGRKVAIQRIDRDPQPGYCQILFVGDQAEAFRNPSMPRGVLTVGEGDAFARNGGIIGFILEKGRVTFNINLRVAEAAGFRFSSGLLAVAKTVIK
jgi:uncharacterized protein DUF4154